LRCWQRHFGGGHRRATGCISPWHAPEKVVRRAAAHGRPTTGPSNAPPVRRPDTRTRSTPGPPAKVAPRVHPADECERLAARLGRPRHLCSRAFITRAVLSDRLVGAAPPVLAATPGRRRRASCRTKANRRRAIAIFSDWTPSGRTPQREPRYTGGELGAGRGYRTRRFTGADTVAGGWTKTVSTFGQPEDRRSCGSFQPGGSGARRRLCRAAF